MRPTRPPPPALQPATGAVGGLSLGDGSVRLLPADIAAAAPRHPAGAWRRVLSPVSDLGGRRFFITAATTRPCASARRCGDGLANSQMQVDRPSWRAPGNGWRCRFDRQERLVVKAGEVARVSARIPHGRPRFHKDGSRIACAHYGGVTVWSIGTSRLPRRPLRMALQPLALALSTDVTFIATGTQKTTSTSGAMAQATDIRMQGYPAKLKSLSWTADARFLYTSAIRCAPPVHLRQWS